ncbi:MAG: hypothetical protein AAF242_09575, partial [Bacteroidota bacterium]
VVKQFNRCNDVYIAYLSKKYGNQSLKAFCYDPGLVNTSIHSGWPFPLGFVMRNIAKPLFMKSPEEAAIIPVRIITELFKPDGIFVNSKAKQIKAPKETEDRAYQERVIELSEKMIESITN